MRKTCSMWSESQTYKHKDANTQIHKYRFYFFREKNLLQVAVFRSPLPMEGMSASQGSSQSLAQIISWMINWNQTTMLHTRQSPDKEGIKTVPEAITAAWLFHFEMPGNICVLFSPNCIWMLNLKQTYSGSLSVMTLGSWSCVLSVSRSFGSSWDKTITIFFMYGMGIWERTRPGLSFVRPSLHSSQTWSSSCTWKHFQAIVKA